MAVCRFLPGKKFTMNYVTCCKYGKDPLVIDQTLLRIQCLSILCTCFPIQISVVLALKLHWSRLSGIVGSNDALISDFSDFSDFDMSYLSARVDSQVGQHLHDSLVADSQLFDGIATLVTQYALILSKTRRDSLDLQLVGSSRLTYALKKWTR